MGTALRCPQGWILTIVKHSWNQHPTQDEEHIHHTRKVPSLSPARRPLICFLSLQSSFCLFQNVVQVEACSKNCLMFFRFFHPTYWFWVIHWSCCMYSQFALFKKLLSCVPLEEYIINLLSYILSFTQLSLCGHLDCFQLLALIQWRKESLFNIITGTSEFMGRKKTQSLHIWKLTQNGSQTNG